MIDTLPHIAVCVCTYKRPELLTKCLHTVLEQDTHDAFTVSLVVADNDAVGSARSAVENVRRDTAISVEYVVEPEQNIARVRNKVVATARGDYLAFIDDDEFPADDWLFNAFNALQEFDVDGILGPVHPHYVESTPKWIIKGKFYVRPNPPSGTPLGWLETRTGNVLIKAKVVRSFPVPFDPNFGRGGEDRDFFRRALVSGYRFVWCAEAAVYETVPLVRCTRSFLLRRALLRGVKPQFRFFDYLKSIIAIPLYAISLPLWLLIGHHRFMNVLVRMFDHIGRLLSLVGIDVIKQKYIMS